MKHLHLASCDHEASRECYETYFGFRFDATVPRGDQPAAPVIRSPNGFQLYLEGASTQRLPIATLYIATSGDNVCRPSAYAIYLARSRLPASSA